MEASNEAAERDSPAGSAHAAARTAVTSLKLTDFRNYATLSLSLDERPVVLTGPNGAGKTNLLEAVSFLSPGRGIRGARIDAVGRQGGDGGWAIAAEVANGDGAVALGTGVMAGETRRKVRVNHAPAGSSAAFLDHLRVLWLTPAMDGLFTGPPADRRRFLDRAVLAIDKTHGTRANAFERAMRGRNRLLAEPAPDSRWLDAIEAEMAGLGVAIAAARREWAGLAAAMLGDAEAAGPFPTAVIALDGTLETDLGHLSASAAEDAYHRRLRDERRRDAAAGRTLAGPHRSDLIVRHGPKDMPAETCSTGEQKALLVGLVLAQTRLVTRLTGETPVVLLDEIAAHLDETRRAALFDLLTELGCQAFMTGTDAAVFAPLANRAQAFAVAGGTVHQE
ncbi:DNA replication/repair protein RecF [Bauldia sp.]|uniref:DNA replication/repair protein RecF n=1 Tax=Bauldia sp. TaxID=2575872 RepID=UPI0025BC7D87|nr:DNA replication/repair protein RecF [Bauldia sp.]